MPCGGIRCGSKCIDGKYSPVENDGTVSAADVVGDLCREAFVVHEENVDFSDIVHEELLKTVGKKVTSLMRTFGMANAVRYNANLLVTSVPNLYNDKFYLQHKNQHNSAP